MKIFQVGVILVCLGFSDGAFTCYHGQGTGSKYVATECPSKICVIFNSACGQYTSTTCYNDQNPMKVVNSFEGAAFYYKNSAQSTSFGYCNVSECNKWMSTLTNQYVILSDPSSFDHLLSAAVKQEEIKKKLQNGIKLPNGIGTDETFKFVGQTFKNSKSPWLAFSCTYNNGSTMKFQIYFDLKNSKLVSKTITVVSKTQKTKQINETWTNPTKPGGQISIALKNINPGFRLIVNDVVYAKFMNDKSIKNVNLVTYGSAWTMNSSSNVDKSGASASLNMLPTFYSELIPINFLKLKGNSKNLKLVAQEFGLSKNQQESRFPMDTVGLKKLTNYEFRESENPQSDLIKLQFQNIAVSPAEQYIIFWMRIKSIWSTSGIILVNRGNLCSSYNIGVTLNGVNFYCGDVLSHNISYQNFGSIVKFRFQNEAHPAACPASDPYQRLLGRMPRITNYSF